MKKSMFEYILKQCVKQKMLAGLNLKKELYSKVNKLENKFLKMMSYLMPKKIKACINEIKTVFKLRSRITNVKTNMQGVYATFECTACKNDEESPKQIC